MLRPLSLLAICFLLACSSSQKEQSAVVRKPSSLEVALGSQKVRGDFSGRLILPKVDERKPDGGVWLQVLKAPENHSDLLGQTVWLILSSDSARLKASKAGVLSTKIPSRLEGWKNISSFEFLAGSHPIDDVYVTVGDEVDMDIQVLTVEGDSALSINKNPLVLPGPGIR